ncbi:MAG: tetratricopeptide repeat protein [Anaerolineae bacterium]|nr:tetratricopeptide repeat protein [Anaerolineae bacterium]
MSQISLHDYVDEIARAIQNGQVDQAFQHCRHILGYYPMYLPVYRLLGRASLDKGDYAHAMHYYQSLLSADPEDADAWANLATLSEDLGELDQATWLMERAFEIEPGNADYRHALRQLYGKRDGVEAPRVKLTRAALGRLYAAGGFHRRSIQELQRLLQGDAAPAPLHTAYIEVALARSYWMAGDMFDTAEQICHSLLEKLPNCLQGNLLLGQILWNRGLEEQAAPHLRIARALDPEGKAAWELLAEESPLPVESVEVPYLEIEPEERAAAAVAGPVDETGWLDEVGRTLQMEPGLDEMYTPGTEAPPPAWLSEAMVEEQPEAAPIAPPPEAEVPEEEHVAELPDWLLEAQAPPAAPIAEPPPEPPIEPPTERLAAALAEPQAGADERDLLAAEPEAELAEERAPTSSAEEGELAPSDELGELPDWLQDVAFQGEGAAEPGAAAEGREAGELPEWLEELREHEPGDLELEETIIAGPEEAESADWLTEEAGAPLAKAADIADDQLPEWLQAIEPEVQEEEEAADWLAEIETDAEEATETWSGPSVEEELPDWLQELRSYEPLSDQEQEAEDLPDWLAEIAAASEPDAPQPMHALDVDNLPDWLEELREDELDLTGEEGEELLIEAPDEVDLSDWVGELEAAPGAAPVEPAEPLAEGELPDWLQALRAQEPALPDEDQGPEATYTAEVPDWLDQVGAPSEGLPETPDQDLELGQIPDWLEELGIQEPTPPAEEEKEAFFGPAAEEPAAVAAEAVPAPEAAPEDLAPTPLPSPVEDVPDWLAQLEAEIGAPAIDEMPVSEVTPQPVAAEEESMPEWLIRLRREQGLEPEPEEAPEELLEEIVSTTEPPLPPEPVRVGETAPEERVETVYEAVQEGVAEEGIAKEPVAEEVVAEEVVAEEAVAEAAVAEEPVAEEVVAEAAIAEEPVAEEVVAEEVVAEEPVAEAPVTEEAVAEAPVAEEAVAEAPVAEAAVAEAPVTEAAPQPQPGAPEIAPQPDPQQQLAAARSSLALDDPDTAAALYEELVPVARVRDQLLRDLELATQAHESHHALYRVLGDVYVRSGQLGRALRAYQQALKNLK